MIKIEKENEKGERVLLHQEESLGAESQKPLFLQVLKSKKQISYFLKTPLSNVKDLNYRPHSEKTSDG